jgi:DNA invertase Pin-like site-specific DNA recombinase
MPGVTVRNLSKNESKPIFGALAEYERELIRERT